MGLHDRIDRLDVSVCRHIEGQCSEDDLRSFLAVQSACRQWKGRPYTVLEIGSYLGGSLQSHVSDPACERIISIDPRPSVVRDERGSTWDYSGVSAADMLARLAEVPNADVGKVHAITSSTDRLRVDDLPARPDVCFVDGEHTDDAVLRDARFCLAAVGPAGVIAFHDANIVYRALLTFIQDLEATGRPFRAYNLPSVVFVVEIGDCRLSELEPLRTWREQSFRGFLASLMRNDHFRDVAMRHERATGHPVFAVLRKVGVVAAMRRLFLKP